MISPCTVAALRLVNDFELSLTYQTLLEKSLELALD